MSPTPEQRIAQLEAELAAQRAEMQDFTYTVSHDLRASLRHILSYAKLVQEDAAPLLTEELQGFLQTITDSARHMGVLMDGLVELSRLGTVALQPEAVPLQGLVPEVCAALTAQHSARNITWKVADDLPVVQADAALLRLALQHVLGNAVKFSAPRAEAVIAVTARVEPEGVRLCIEDNGVGYNPAMQSRLFHPFQRLHSAKQFEGIGMGLALTRKILQRLGGSVAAQSLQDAGNGSPSSGVRVTLVLPAGANAA